jgi:hypothetical protein
MKNQTQAVKDVVAERLRQQTEEGHTIESDVKDNLPGEMALGAAAMAAQTGTMMARGEDAVRGGTPSLWPWPAGYKWHDERRNLVIAAALILAEIERLDASKQ